MKKVRKSNLRNLKLDKNIQVLTSKQKTKVNGGSESLVMIETIL